MQKLPTRPRRVPTPEERAHMMEIARIREEGRAARQEQAQERREAAEAAAARTLAAEDYAGSFACNLARTDNSN